jgi:hypothetical protein
LQHDRNVQYACAAVLVIAGGTLIPLAWSHPNYVVALGALFAALPLLLVGVCLARGQTVRDVKLSKTGVELSLFGSIAAAPSIPQRVLEEHVIREKKLVVEEVKKEHALPGHNAPHYSALASISADDLLVRPSAYPMTPMYLLDGGFRILDWNEAFSVAFDRTMEGRQGESVLEWTYFLDNFKEVFEHGVKPSVMRTTGARLTSKKSNIRASAMANYEPQSAPIRFPTTMRPVWHGWSPSMSNFPIPSSRSGTSGILSASWERLSCGPNILSRTIAC